MKSLNEWGFLKVPLILAILLGVIYLLELGLASSLRFGATYSLITGLPDSYDPLIQVISPFLHSSHRHIIANLAYFLLLSAIILPHTRPQKFLIIFLFSAWLTASILPGIFAGGANYGISGANASLAGWETVYRIRNLSEKAAEVDSFISYRYGMAIGLLMIPAIILALNLAPSLGLAKSSQGVSSVGHFIGGLFGVAYGIVENIDL